MPLKTRKVLPPGGFFFYESRTGWSPMQMLDFETTVNLIINHRKANPRFAGEWSTDFETVANELDHQTCLQLASMGLAQEHCIGTSFQVAQSQAALPVRLGHKVRESVAAVSKYAAGMGVLIEWLGDSGEAIDPDKAEWRAGICSSCPKNRKGELKDFFAVEASEVIRKQLELKNDMKLSTSHDPNLGVCGACLCPLKLKVWTPIEHILRHTSDRVKGELDPMCWITK